MYIVEQCGAAGFQRALTTTMAILRQQDEVRSRRPRNRLKQGATTMRTCLGLP